MNSELFHLGLKVLIQIPTQAICNTLFSRHVNLNDGWVRLAGERLSDSIFNAFGSTFTSKRNPELGPVTEMIFRNTTKMLEEEDDPVVWINSFSGQNLRWEAIGVLFTYWAFGAISSPEDDPIFVDDKGNKRDRRQYMIELKECASSCIALCSHVDRRNPLVVYLLYKHSLLESIISGDASLIYWRQHGDLISMTTALGLHRDVDPPSPKVSISSEMRRRIFAAVFNIDKVIATFMGRPPMMSGRYTSTPLPLDLSDEVLLAGEPLLSNAVASLDSNGWNTENCIYSTTILRARTSFAFIRDEILALALGSSVGGTVDHIQYLKTRSENLYSQLPLVIVYHADDISNPSIPSRTLYSRLLTHLENLQNLFLLERLLLKHGYADIKNLIDISMEMLAMTSGIWKQRDRLTGFHSDFEWLIMYHAIPAAGLLCVELLRNAQAPTSQSILPISDTIQNLSLLIGFLDWVKPSAPNSRLCYRIRDIIRKVLDQVLDSPFPDRPEEVAGWDAGSEIDFNLSDFDDYVNFDLLDTFDWVNKPWVGEIAT